MRILAAALLILAFGLAPVVASADQYSDLLAQLNALTAQLQRLQNAQAPVSPSASWSAKACVELGRDLAVDSTDALTGGQVGKLQQFLINASVYPEARVTGYFGPATLRAVQRWQAQNGIVSSGGPESTGYGFVGPRTRAAMAAGCIPAMRTTSTTAPVCHNGDDYYDGGADTDTLTYSGKRSEFVITKNSNGTYTFRDTVACRAGTDTVVNIELVQFADGLYAIETLVDSVDGLSSTPTIAITAISPEGIFAISYRNMPPSRVRVVAADGATAWLQDASPGGGDQVAVGLRTPLPTGTYYVQAVSTVDGTVVATSALHYFVAPSVTPQAPSISLVSPGAGSVLPVGSVAQIQWTSSNAAAHHRVALSIDIGTEECPNSSCSRAIPWARDLPTNGSLSWLIWYVGDVSGEETALSAGPHRIRAVLYDPNNGGQEVVHTSVPVTIR